MERWRLTGVMVVPRVDAMADAPGFVPHGVETALASHSAPANTWRAYLSPDTARRHTVLLGAVSEQVVAGICRAGEAGGMAPDSMGNGWKRA